MTPFERYITGLTAGDPVAVVDALAPDVVLRVAVHDRSIHGVDAAAVVFGLLFDGILSGVRVGERIGDGDARCVLFDAEIAGFPGRAEGATVAHLDAKGRVGEVVVFLRPLAALSALARLMGERFRGAPSDRLPDARR